MKQLVKARAVPPTTLELTFRDGQRASIDLTPLLSLEAFASLQDPSFFERAEVNEIGGVYWPNGADLSPEYLEAAASAALRREH